MFNYWEAEQGNLLKGLERGFRSGSFRIREEDGKIGVNVVPLWDTPWIVSGKPRGVPCAFLKDILFKYARVVPSRCQECWKVVAKPKTVVQLFGVYDYQKDLDPPCKCGIELRTTTSGLYGAYWYNDSVEEGIECRDKVREDLKDLGEFPIYLKRACTEYEAHLPMSNKWFVSDEQKRVEKLFEDNIVVPDIDNDFEVPWYVKQRTKGKWIEHACRYGDMTYKELTNGTALTSPQVIYNKGDDGKIQGFLPDYITVKEGKE